VYSFEISKDKLLRHLLTGRRWHKTKDCIHFFKNETEFAVAKNQMISDRFIFENVAIEIMIRPEGKLFIEKSSYLRKAVWRDTKIVALFIGSFGAATF